MPTLALTTIAEWVWLLFINIAGDPVLAGIIGFIVMIIFGIRLGLGFDGLIVLGIFSATMLSRFIFPFDLGMLFILAISISVVSLAALRLTRH